MPRLYVSIIFTSLVVIFFGSFELKSVVATSINSNEKNNVLINENGKEKSIKNLDEYEWGSDADQRINELDDDILTKYAFILDSYLNNLQNHNSNPRRSLFKKALPRMGRSFQIDDLNDDEHEEENQNFDQNDENLLLDLIEAKRALPRMGRALPRMGRAFPRMGRALPRMGRGLPRMG